MNEERKGAIEAESLLESLGIDELPVRPIDVAKALDDDSFSLVFEFQPFESESILGKAIGNDSAAVVYVNSNIPDERRKNFTAAHELGHVCMHIIPSISSEFECGEKEITNPYYDPIERQANGFATGLLMPESCIRNLVDCDLNWRNVQTVSGVCATSLEATVRRLFSLSMDPAAFIIHKDGKFVRFVPSDSFSAFIKRESLSSWQVHIPANVNT